MRLFLLNRSKGFKVKDISKRSRVDADTVRKELRLLSSVGFIRKHSKISKDWYFNISFKYAEAFDELLVRSNTLNQEKIIENFQKVGKIKLLIVSGVFIKNHNSRVDLLIVGNKINKRKIEIGIRRLESEIGIELTYAIFDTKEFIYRLNMYDKLIRDILDYPHEVVLQDKELSTQVLKK